MPLSRPSPFEAWIAQLQTIETRRQASLSRNLERMRASITALDRADSGSEPSPEIRSTMTGSIPVDPTAAGPTDVGPEALLRSFLPPRGRGAAGGDYGRSVLGAVLATYLGRGR